jgi:hypothetical protein
MGNNERTSKEVASLAAKALAGQHVTKKEVQRIAASVLTQTRDKPKKRKK